MKISKVLAWIAVALWMMGIFYLSAQPAVDSNRLSKGVTQVMIEVVEKVVPDAEIDIREFTDIIRSIAHFISYFVLGWLVMNALSRGVRAEVSASYRVEFKNLFFAALICIVYAVSDEFHQIFVPGRSAEGKDVLTDIAGAAAGIGVYSGIRWILRDMRLTRRKKA